MFVVTTVFDTIRIPPLLLSMPTVQAVHSEIDQKYPNRVLMDVGLVVGRYGECARVGHGFCVSGDGGAHHECEFRLIVFRPFVEEVCLGRITKSTAEGIHVSIGFFVDIFIPAYWMLRPSHYEEKSGLWIWTPKYDDDEEDAEDEADDAASIRRRSSSVGLDENQALPPSMHIVASICEDGLGLTTWWAAPVEDDDDEDMKEEPKQEEN
ncbi:predicted protein [Phaeodactylum tricornutum CCAP 1055/1]|uniref:RNA polymerase III subunit Rpc25 domain-containing protein n=3 Tax=Phaeodactylum tricornutum TaxID=2850 RepID=B7FXF2_PHATC|nr:predicted protein [Phaeodactylum tricornutum CCAP 1055/1]EEC49369.1 predicted protein [Phaeodactylum tricornutum CCAP 1055/1]|eukprot:XP_002179546.1 predicted protein [Phaeodactylum tricornutum CCAP 1055/1]